VDRKLKVTILYDAVEDREKALAIERGEKVSPLVHEEVGKLLAEAGHAVQRIAARSALELATQLEQDDSDLIFNVCESLGGVPYHEPNVAALL
jgi:hypothetical protein